jgi:hypothetical protein
MRSAIKITTTTLNVLPSLRVAPRIAVATIKTSATALKRAAQPATRREVGDVRSFVPFQP